jgi:hypothetical protein
MVHKTARVPLFPFFPLDVTLELKNNNNTISRSEVFFFYFLFSFLLRYYTSLVINVKTVTLELYLYNILHNEWTDKWMTLTSTVLLC